MIVLPQDWEDKNVNTSLLDGQDGEKPGNETTSHHITPVLNLESGGGRRAGSDNKTKLNSKCGSGQGWM